MQLTILIPTTAVKLAAVTLLAVFMAGCGSGEKTDVTAFDEPVAAITWSPEVVYAGQEVLFDGSASRSPSGELVAWVWDFDGDGGVDATGPEVSHIVSYSGEYAVRLTVIDSNGAEAVATKEMVVTVKLLER